MSIVSTSVLPRKPMSGSGPESVPPPLETGDRLTRPEFERRYNAMPEVKKAELIEGTVYMPSPVSLRHARPHNAVAMWLGRYEIATAGVVAADNGTVRLDLDNEPQPDVCLFILPECGGAVAIDDDDYISGAPELVVEVSSSTASIDLHAKLRAYQRNGVKEYLVVMTRDRKVRWHVLTNGEFVAIEPNSRGIFVSATFPGLALDAEALLAQDYARVIGGLEEALKSEEHSKFLERLAAARVTRAGQQRSR